MKSVMVPSQKLAHRSYVRDIATYANKWVVTAGYDGKICVFDAFTGEVLSGIRAHLHSAESVLAIPEQKLVVSGGADGYLRLWEINEKGELGLHDEWKLPGSNRLTSIETMALHPSKTLISLGTLSGAVWLLDLSSNRLAYVKDVPIDVKCMAFSPDGTQLFVGADDCRIHTYQLVDKQLEYRSNLVSPTLDDHIASLTVDQNELGQLRIACVTHGNGLYIFEDSNHLATYRHIPVGRFSNNTLLRLQGEYIVAGDDGLVYRITDGQDTAHLLPVEPFIRDIHAIAKSSDEQNLYIATTAGAFGVDLSRNVVLPFEHRHGALAACAVDTKIIYAGFHDQPYVQLGHWKNDRIRPMHRVKLDAPVSCADKYEPVFGLKNGQIVKIYPEGTSKELAKLPYEVEAVAVVRTSDGHPSFFAADRSGNGIYHKKDGTPVSFQITENSTRIKSLDWAADKNGKIFCLAVGKDRKIYRIDVHENDTVSVKSIEGFSFSHRTLNAICHVSSAVLDDTLQAFVGSWDDHIYEVKLDEDRMLGVRLISESGGHHHCVDDLLMANLTLFSASYDGTIKAWNIQDGGVRTLKVSDMAIRHMGFVDEPLRDTAEQPIYIAAASYDGCIYIIDPIKFEIMTIWEVNNEARS